MASRSGKGSAKEGSLGEALAESLDRLYAAPLDAFIATRKAIADELRAKGEDGIARRVAASKKPTPTTWALNQVARRRHELLESLFAARARAESLEGKGDPATFGRSVKEYRQALAELVHAAREILAEAGKKASAAQLRKMGESLQAAGSDTAFLRTQLLGGRLERDASPGDAAFGTSREASTHARPPAAATVSHANKAHHEERERRARVEREQAIAKARHHLDALEAQARKARAGAERSDREATAARIEADRHEELARRAEAEALRAKRELAKLTSR